MKTESARELFFLLVLSSPLSLLLKKTNNNEKKLESDVDKAVGLVDWANLSVVRAYGR